MAVIGKVIGFVVFAVGFSAVIVALTAAIRWLAQRRLITWIAALLILFVGAALYAISLFVALASDDSTWDRYIPLFRLGQGVGFFVFVVGLLGIVIIALTKGIGMSVKRIKHKAGPWGA